MTPNYYSRESASRDRWMVSYMDVLTILLIFFVAIAAQSLDHTPKVARAAATAPAPIARLAPVVESPAASQKIAPPARPSSPDPSQALLRALHQLDKNGLDLRLEARGLVISLPQAILFSSGEDRVSRQALPILSRIADVLRDLPNPVSLVGHADAVPIHNRHFHNNWDLSTARSLQILKLLSHSYGISESRLSIASYGAYRPSDPNDTSAGRAHNRRVEIVISDSALQAAQPDTRP
jgi:chemotaxis protein MotB